MNNLTNILLIGILVSVGVVGFAVSNIDTPNITVDVPEAQVVRFGGDLDLTRWGSNVTATTVSVSITNLSTSTNEVLAANSSAVYRRLQNVGVPEVTCQLTSATTGLSAGVGIVLTATATAASNVYERYYGYWGKINCISTGSTGTISVIQY